MTDDQSYDPKELNLTELVAVAAEINSEAHRWLPREVLEMITMGEEVALPDRIVNKKRLQIMQHINKNWNAVSYQVSCPAKSRDPEACFNCPDFQVSSCTLENKKLFLPDE